MIDTPKSSNAPQNPFEGINPDDLNELGAIGAQLGDAERRRGDASKGFDESFAQEMGNPRVPLTPEERREKEVRAFVEQMAKTAIEGPLPKLTALQKWHRFFGTGPYRYRR